MNPLLLHLRAQARPLLALLLLLHSLTLTLGAAETKSFSLAAGPAEKTLPQFIAQSGLQVAFSPDAVKGVTTRPIAGEHEPAVALEKLLDGTGLVAVADVRPGAYAIRRGSVPNAPRAGATPAPAPEGALAPANAKPGSPNSSSPPDGSNVVVELSPFTVNASNDTGWRAQNTLAGSRLNSSLKDTPAVMDVLTADFLQEIGVTTLEDALKLSANYDESYGDLGDASSIINASFPGAIQNLNFNTRGQGGALARNFISTSFRPEFYTIERIDNSSGPNAILFGIGGAGGVANVSTKRTKLNRTETAVDLRADANGSLLASIDTNHVLVRQNLGLRLNAIRDRARTYREHSNNDLDGIHLTAKWRPTSKTEINVELERDVRTGLVVDPRPMRERLTAWLGAGSKVLTVPTDWTTLSTAARTAYLATTATPAGIGVFGSGERWVYVGDGPQSFLVSQRNSLQSQGNPANPPAYVDNDALAPLSVNLSGPGGRKEVNRSLATVSLDQRLAETLYLNLSLSREYGDTTSHQTFFNGTGTGDTFVSADPNATLNNAASIFNPNARTFATNSSGQTLNPYAGRQFVEGRWFRRQQDGGNKYAQTSLAWKIEAGRWGRHNLVANAAYSEGRSSAVESNLVWRGAPFNATINNAANLIYLRHYVTPGDASSYYAGDWKDAAHLQWTHPTLGLITPDWVPQTVRKSRTRNVNGLVAVQSFLFKNRLSTTLGLRRDEQTTTTFSPVTIRPAPYASTSGFPIIDQTSPVSQVVNAGNTRSLGAVWHAFRNVSAYYNTSSSFAPGNALLYGPDGLPSPQQDGSGKDYGLKFDFLDGKISIDLGSFTTSTINSPNTLGINSRDATNSVFANWNAIFNTLNAPAAGSPRLLNTGDPAALDALKASYSELRPAWVAQADLLDRASRGHEVRLIANPFKGLRFRATYANTEYSKENILKNTRKAREQLGQYLSDLQTKHPSVNVPSLTRGGAADLTVGGYLAFMDTLIEEIIDLNLATFGNSKHRFNANLGYDLAGAFTGWSVGTGVSYKSGTVVSSYQIIDPAQPRVVINDIPIYSASNMEWSANLRYRTRFTAFGRSHKVTLQLNASNLFRSSPELLVRRYNTIVVAPGAAFPAPVNPTSSFLLAPRTISGSVKISF